MTLRSLDHSPFIEYLLYMLESDSLGRPRHGSGNLHDVANTSHNAEC